MIKIAVLYHSGYGNTTQMAQAVARGARSVEGVEAELIFAKDVTNGGEESPLWKTLDEAHAHIYGTPTYMGTISSDLKAFFETKPLVKRWVSGAWANKIAGGFSNSSSPSGDKFHALSDLFTISMQMGMVWIGNALPPAGKDGGNREDLNRLGGWIGAMAQSPQGEHEGPISGDLQTAEAFGKRIAQAAIRWNAGV